VAEERSAVATTQAGESLFVFPIPQDDEGFVGTIDLMESMVRQGGEVLEVRLDGERSLTMRMPAGWPGYSLEK
jgi:hypothetical protein